MSISFQLWSNTFHAIFHHIFPRIANSPVATFDKELSPQKCKIKPIIKLIKLQSWRRTDTTKMAQHVNPFKNTALYFRISGTIGATPFSWRINPKKPLHNPLQLQLKTHSLWLWRFYNIYQPVYTIFLWITLYHYIPIYIDQSQLIELSIHIFFNLGHLCAISFELHQKFYKKEMSTVTNEMIKFADELLCKLCIKHF